MHGPEIVSTSCHRRLIQSTKINNSQAASADGVVHWVVQGSTTMRMDKFSRLIMTSAIIFGAALVACDDGVDPVDSGLDDAGETDAGDTDADLEDDPPDGDLETPDSDLEENDGDIEEVDSGEGDADEEPPVELTWGECDLSEWPVGYPPPAAGVECTLIQAPLDYDDPDDDTIWLTVARHSARNNPGREAVFIIAGGPGGTSVAESGMMSQVIPDVLDRFDLVYLDQRGTGGSNYLGCPRDIYELEDLEDCGDSHAGRDLNRYRTLDAAHDFDFVRRAMGYEQISLIGGSYGVRLALEIIRQHEDIVNMTVLAGVMTPDTDWLGDGLTFFGRGIDLLIEECAGSEACTAASPNLERALDTWREALREEPRPIVFEGYGADVEDEGFFLYVLSRLIGEASFRARIPRAIHDAVHGDTDGWNDLMSNAVGIRVTDGGAWTPTFRSSGFAPELPRNWFSLGDFISWGVYMTVLCGEYLPSTGGIDSLYEIVNRERWPNDNLAFSASACPHWGVDPIDEELLQPVVSDVPSLLVSGQFDINTIPEWGDHAAESLSNSTHIVVPHATHLTLWDNCPAQIASDFLLADGDAAVLDTSCLAEIGEPSW